MQEKYTDFRDVCFVVEHAGRSLRSRLEAGTRFRERDISLVVYQILSAVNHLHTELSVIHRDLTPANVVVDDDCNVKLVDYGLARYWSKELQRGLYLYDMTQPYQAPELLCELADYTTAVDVWAVGCIFAELLLQNGGVPLFNTSTDEEQLCWMLEMSGPPGAGFLQRLNSGHIRQVIESKLRAMEENGQGREWAGMTVRISGHQQERLRQKVKAPTWAFADANTQRFTCESAGGQVLQSLLTCCSVSNALDLLSGMLEFDPAERVGVVKALRHDFVEMWDREEDHCPPKKAFDAACFERVDDKSEDHWKAMLFFDLKEMEKQGRKGRGGCLGKILQRMQKDMIPCSLL